MLSGILKRAKGRRRNEGPAGAWTRAGSMAFRLIRAVVIGLALGLLLQPWTGPMAEAVRDRVTAWRGEWPKTDFSRSSVKLEEFVSGGPPKDGIPAIDRPRFIKTGDADRWLKPTEPVIALEIGGDARAYPIQILMFHEIVNDTVGGIPVSVTFCPLCNAALTFERTVSGRLLDFGTTGRLRKSDLVMYDRQTESWWQQFTGEAMVGELTGTRLVQRDSAIVAYADFRNTYPDGRVLSRNTGHFRIPYGTNPYRGYDRVGETPFLFQDPTDPRLPAMERVLNVSIEGRHRLYPLRVLERQPVINDELAGQPLVVFGKAGMNSPLDQERIVESALIPAAAAFGRRLDGQVLEFRGAGGRFYDVGTGSEWNLFGHAVAGPWKGRRLDPLGGGVHFAFAWLAFNPDSEIYASIGPEAAHARREAVPGRLPAPKRM